MSVLVIDLFELIQIEIEQDEGVWSAVSSLTWRQKSGRYVVRSTDRCWPVRRVYLLMKDRQYIVEDQDQQEKNDQCDNTLYDQEL